MMEDILIGLEAPWGPLEGRIWGDGGGKLMMCGGEQLQPHNTGITTSTCYLRYYILYTLKQGAASK